MPKFNAAEAKKAGYDDKEILQFLSEEHPRFNVDKARDSGYSDNDILDYLSSEEATSKQNDFAPSVPRAIAQVPLGLAEAAGPGLLASVLKTVGKGEALGALDDELSPERIADLRSKFPQFEIPEVDREKYLQSVEEAASSFPTVENISRFIEEKTGIPLQPKSELDNSIRFISSVGGFARGGPAEKIFSGLKAETAKRVLDQVGVPEPVSEALGLYYGLRSKTPGPTGVLNKIDKKAKEKVRLQGKIGERAASKKPEFLESEKEEFERLGKMVSPVRFGSDAKAGRAISDIVKERFKEAKADYTQKYAKAREATRGYNDIFPSLANKVEETLQGLHESATPSSAEKFVIKQLQDLQGLIGTNSGLIEAPLDRLVKTADSVSSSLKYEIPDPGVRNLLKEFVRDMNEQVATSLERQGGSAKWLKEADRSYAKAADLYFSDELSPFLAKTIRNPESLSKLAENPGSFRAIREALAGKSKNALSSLERQIAEQIIKKYIKNPAEVLGLEFEQDMSNLEELIGPKAIEVKREILRRAKNKAVFKGAVDLARSAASLFGAGKAVQMAGKSASILKDLPQ